MSLWSPILWQDLIAAVRTGNADWVPELPRRKMAYPMSFWNMPNDMGKGAYQTQESLHAQQISPSHCQFREYRHGILKI